MDKERALSQQIRPLEIAILNIVPTEVHTETQFMRLLANSPLQVNITLIKPSYYDGKYAVKKDFEKLYKNFGEAERNKFDGMIITGTPDISASLEKSVNKRELQDILDWTKSNVTSTLFSCLGAQAALSNFYKIKKHPVKYKCFGIFAHQRIRDGVAEPLMNGIPDEFDIPHYRHAVIFAKDIMHVKELKILAYSKKTGVSVIKSVDNRQIYVTGHIEYDRFTLKQAHERDLANGLQVKPPINYFTDRGMTDVKMNWTSAANLFFMNWLNHCVYQVTPYDINEIEA